MSNTLRFLICTLLGASFSFSLVQAQCTLLTTPVTGDSLRSSRGAGTQNRSGLVFHPTYQLYYSVNAGSPNYPIDTYDSNGNLLDSTTQGFSYRGLWYNPGNGQLEGNGFGGVGIIIQNLNLNNGMPLGSGSMIFSTNQPDGQSVGDLDTSRNEIVYYFNGQIHRYDRDDNSSLGSTVVTGLPTSLVNFNSTSVIYTGCPTREYGVLDYANKELYLINANNFVVTDRVPLPADAPGPARFGFAYTYDGLVWIYNQSTRYWRSYRVFDRGGTSTEAKLVRNAAPSLRQNPVGDYLRAEVPSALRGFSFSVIDYTGRVIFSDISARNGSLEIEVSTLTAGTYLLRWTGPAGVGSLRFLK